MRGGLALLRAEISEVYSGGKSGSMSVVKVGDGARYWRAFCAMGNIEEIKSPCAGRGFRCGSLTLSFLTRVGVAITLPDSDTRTSSATPALPDYRPANHCQSVSVARTRYRQQQPPPAHHQSTPRSASSPYA